MASINRMTFLMAISEITPQIFISGQMAATLEQVQRLGITYIVNVALESSVIVYPKNIKLDKFDILDFPNSPISNYFNTITDKIHAHLTANKQHKVLVHCMAGISRSTTIVCAYLMRCMNLSLRDAYLLCKKHRPIIFPNLGFWNQLIAYESQLRKQNSVKMIPTQYGNVPDVAFEEIQQYTTQHQKPTESVPLSTMNNPINSSIASSDLISNQSRSTGRDSYPNRSGGLTRSRSLASQSTIRPSVAAASTYVSNPAYQTSIFTNKPSFLTPNRSGPGRPLANNGSNQNSFASASTIYTSSRSIPVSVPANVKHRYTNHHQPHHHPHYHHHHHQQQQQHHLPNSSMNSMTGTVNNDQQRARYDTTYRSSFIRPLEP